MPSDPLPRYHYLYFGMAEPSIRPGSNTSNSFATWFKSLFRQKLTSASLPMSSQPFSKPCSQRLQPLQVKLPSPQPQSPFLTKLPLEIREAIYVHVFGHSLLHLVDMGQRMAHVRCPQEVRDRVWDGHRHGIAGLGGYPILNEEECPNDALLALCKTCRMVYVGHYIFSDALLTPTKL